MNKSLEELKVIRDGASDNDVFFDGRYLNSKMCARNTVNGTQSNYYYDDPFYIDVEELIPLSAINRIIELEEWKIQANLNYQSMLNAYLND